MSPIAADLLRALLWLGGGAAFGWLLDEALGALAAVLVVACFIVGRQLWQLSQLIRWAQQPVGTETPTTSGAWEEVYDKLRRRAQMGFEQREELGKLLDRFRQAAEVMPDGVVILDGHRNIEWMNVSAEQCLNLNALRDLGTPITYLLREPEFMDYLQSHAAGSLTLRSARDPARTLQLQTVPFAAGRSLLLVRDVTNVQRLETMRRDFVANVSHELRTPLTVVAGFLETAADSLDELPADQIRQFLVLAEDQARRMQRLIEDLLTLATLETDAPPQEEAIDMATLLAEVRDDAVALSEGRHAIELENSGPSVLRGSGKELRSALGNLASNAVRYTPAGGRITMSWSDDAAGGAVFAVTDTGIGIEAHHLPRLTERFYRVDRGRSRETGGTGLGLAIVKHVLERHQARLDITSEPGRGSRFAAVFPERRVQPPSAS